MSEFLKRNWFTVGNWMLTGLPFFLLGVLLRKKAFVLKRKWCVCLMAVGYVLTAVFNKIGLPVNLLFPFIVISATVIVVLLNNCLNKLLNHNSCKNK